MFKKLGINFLTNYKIGNPEKMARSLRQHADIGIGIGIGIGIVVVVVVQHVHSLGSGFP